MFLTGAFCSLRKSARMLAWLLVEPPRLTGTTLGLAETDAD